MTTHRWTKSDAAIVLVLMAVAAGVFVTGITWGLPSRAADPYLFGNHPIWTGADIVRLAPEPPADADRGADVDANPITDRRHPVLLNETDAQRAEIVRRYRLFSYQPDEMITFKSLSGMRPGRLDLDPRLYQYGGLWIYPIGGLLKVSSLLGFVDVRSDKAWYLDHPEEFARFYVVARAYSAAWAVVGVAVVYWLVGRMTGSRAAAAVAAVCYTWMPAVVNAAHEAKPHMAGAVLMLTTVAAATIYADTGRRKWAMATGGLAGASVGMVLSGLWAFAVLPVMVLLRPAPAAERLRHLFLATGCGIAAYVLTNPYVAINALLRPSRLTSNLQNSTAMYAVGGSSGALWNAAELVAEGASVVIAVVGTIGVLLLAARWLRTRGRAERGELSGRVPALLLAAVASIVMTQFVLLAAGKPGEYGRFALVPDIALAIAAVVAVAGARGEIGPILRAIVLTVLAVAAVPFGAEYVYAFLRDTRPATSRIWAAEQLRTMPGTIGLRDEPAPYLMPPVNLFDRDLVLLPAGERMDPAVVPVNFAITAIDGPHRPVEGHVVLPTRWRRGNLWRDATRISWANKRFVLTPVRGFLSQRDGEATQTGLADSGRP
jgi:hypothetical protein